MRSLLTLVHAQLGRVAGFGFIAAGAIALLAGYHGVATSAYVAQQLTYVVSGGLVGLFLLGLGTSLLISSDLHDEWRKLAHIEEAIYKLAECGIALDSPGDRPAPPAREAVAITNGCREPVPTRASSERGVAQPMVAMAVGGAVVAAVLLASWSRASNVADSKKAMMAVVIGVVALIAHMAVLLGATHRQRQLIRARSVTLLNPFAATATRLGLLSRGTPVLEQLAGDGDGDMLVTAEGLTFFHRSDCPVVRTLLVREVAAGAVPAHLEPCGLCHA